MNSEVYNIDCLEYMRGLPDKAFQLAIADPPYGINRDGQKLSINKNPKHNRKYFEPKGWDKKAPDKIFFDELLRVCENVILWGANHYISRIPIDSSGWVIWDKGQKGLTMADCELAWTSFDRPARIFVMNRVALLQEGTIHPTQKPVALYAWLLNKFAKPGDRIFDPMMGSQSSRIAAYKMGFDYVGCELDKEYFDKGCERFAKECMGEHHHKDGTIVIEQSLFDL